MSYMQCAHVVAPSDSETETTIVVSVTIAILLLLRSQQEYLHVLLIPLNRVGMSSTCRRTL